jgi:dTDP-4-dehydrorhamnose reductase
MRVLITGAGGMLGQDLARAAHRAGLEYAALARSELDSTAAEAVRAALVRARPALVVNCAAWTDVDGAESAPEAALQINARGAENVAAAAASVGAWTVHISSDYVFDGAKREPYVESDPTAPLSAYGRSKLEGEQAVARAARDAHTVVRSSWLFGAGGRCFPATILRLAAKRDQLEVVDDQVGSPTVTGHLAAALIGLASAGTPPLGIVHLAGGGSCSWFEFATEIVRAAGLSAEVRPCSTADMPRPAPRPAYSVLGSERRELARALPDWRDGLEQYLAETAVPAR